MIWFDILADSKQYVYQMMHNISVMFADGGLNLICWIVIVKYALDILRSYLSL